MDEKTKNIILLNCESYEFFKTELLSVEQEYFDALEELLAVAGNFTDMILEPKDYSDDPIIITKLKTARSWGEKYINISMKFESEMQDMVRLAPELRDSEIEFEGVKDRFLFVSDYIDELEQTLLLQYKMRDCIERQLKLFKGFERYE